MDVEDKMEVDEIEPEVILEGTETEVDSNPSRKTEQLYKMDEEQLLNILPEEIWIMIFGKLKNDPDSQTNCANASPYFWELLKKDRVLFLFPKVMEVMSPQNEKQKVGMFLVTPNKRKQDYAREEHAFWRKNDVNWWRSTISEIRLTCSAWNKAVEDCYQSATMAGIKELSEDSLDPRSPSKRLPQAWTYDLFKIESLGDIRYFLGQFKQSHFSGIGAPPKNPLFGRWLIIKVTKEDNYKKGITKLLQLCGKEIWYCCMDWSIQWSSVNDNSWTTGEEISSELAKWLGLMPNLRFLNMQGPEDVEELSEEDFQENPFPKLENLQMLYLDETHGLIVSEMVRVNSHVKVLRMADINSGVNLEVGQLLGNLKDFSAMPSDEGDKMLEQFGKHWNKLSNLYLIHASKYFGKMETNWGNTLTVLDLKDPFGKDKKIILRESRELRLNLPKIRWLSLWIKGLFYLDFIKGMDKSLEHLVILGVEFKKCGTKGERERVKKEQSLELVGFEGEMQRSNVWDFFGKLETVKMHLGKNTEFLLFSKDGKKYKCKYEEERGEREIDFFYW